jgi:hypothetical protein
MKEENINSNKHNGIITGKRHSKNKIEETREVQKKERKNKS